MRACFALTHPPSRLKPSSRGASVAWGDDIYLSEHPAMPPPPNLSLHRALLTRIDRAVVLARHSALPPCLPAASVGALGGR